jgi:hypothetical protein
MPQKSISRPIANILAGSSRGGQDEFWCNCRFFVPFLETVTICRKLLRAGYTFQISGFSLFAFMIA